MIIKQKTYYSLIFLTLISFGFFGSLSHLFSIALIILTFVSREVSSQKIEINFDAKIVYFALSGVFFLFFITSVFRSNLWVLLQALSPMLPIPLIGILIIFHSRTNLRLSGKLSPNFHSCL